MVIAIIGILASLLLPTLSRAKMKATETSCINNQRQLALAWHMYADDNRGKFVNFNTYSLPVSGPLSPVNTPWRTDIFHNQLVVSIPAGYTGEQAWIYKIEMGYKHPTPQIAGPLFHYAANAAVIHCPGDRRYQLPLALGFCWDSYSGVAFLNGENGGLTNEGQFYHPSERFLWVEGADGRGENVGSWVMANGGNPTNGYADARFGDSPAAFHVTSGTFSFGDGHAESHKWQDPTTIAYANSTAISKEMDSDGTRSAAQKGSVHDQPWVGRRYVTPDNP